MLIAGRNGMVVKHKSVAPTLGQTGGVVLDRLNTRQVQHSPQYFMEKSIEVMRQSISESRKDAKPTPFVGAVIVFPDGKYDTACRGELREGDHAEFTLLERKHRSDNLAGCTLYATLEPCAPGARHSPKLACAERIVNARIKKVYIGVEDPDPTVAGKGIKYLEDHGIQVELYHRELQKQIEDANKEFLQAAIERAKSVNDGELDKSRRGLESVEQDSLIEDLSNELLKKFAICYELDIEDKKIFYRQLSQIGILVRDGDGYKPTGIGYLLFGRKPQLRYHHACINCVFQREGYQEEIYKIDGPLLLQHQKLYEWYGARMPSQTDRSRPERLVKFDYPVEVINELVKNAIVHRDYTIEGAPIYFIIREDEIIIKSPGLPVSPIKLEAIKDFSASSLSRNPEIMFVFEVMKLAEQRGLGFDTVRKLRQDYNLPIPLVTYEAPYIVFTLPRNNQASVVAEYTDGEQQVLEILRLTGRKTRGEIEKMISLGGKTVSRIFNSLIEKGLVVKVGGGRSTSYMLKEAWIQQQGESSSNMVQGELSLPVKATDQSGVHSGQKSGQDVPNIRDDG